MKDLVYIAQKSIEMEKMSPFELLIFLEAVNNTIKNIVVDEKSYTYDVYYALMILTHNFKMINEPNYLNNRNEYSYFEKKICSYYKTGGNREIIPYMLGSDFSKKAGITKSIIRSKQEFILSSFYKQYKGLPEELKHFCEVPDFYPNITDDIVRNIFIKK